LGGAVTSVALVPGAGDCVVGVAGVASAGAVCAKAGVASAVVASKPKVMPRIDVVVMEKAPNNALCRHCDRA
jgi:Fe-S-cluster-containing hydrogenase component 2